MSANIISPPVPPPPAAEVEQVWRCEDCGWFCSDAAGTRIVFDKANRFARLVELVSGQFKLCVCTECQRHPRRKFHAAPKAFSQLPPGDRE